MRRYTVEHDTISGCRPLVYDAADSAAAVPLKEGGKAAKMAGAILDILNEIGLDYGVPEDVLHAPYELAFSFNPLPMYKGLKKGKIDLVRLPKYMALERVAKHEGAHMGHRRILEHRAIQNGEQDAKEVSEKRLEKYYKTHPGLVEKFANKYAGLESANVNIAGFLFSVSTASLPIFINNAMETAPLSGYDPIETAKVVATPLLLLYGTYISGKLLAGEFQSFEKVGL